MPRGSYVNRAMGPRSSNRQFRNRALILAALVGLGLLLVILFWPRPSGYKIYADFDDAGQVVSGGLVQVGGRKVGTISEVKLSPSGLARLELSINDKKYRPLKGGTRAIIRAVGQAGVASRFVELSPGESTNKLADGSVLDRTQTAGVVDIDAVLSSIDADARRDIRGLISGADQIFAGSGAPAAQRLAKEIAPAAVQIEQLANELGSSSKTIGQMVVSASTVSRSLAKQSQQLNSVLVNGSRTFSALAASSQELRQGLRQAPEFLAQANKTLATTQKVVDAARPTLRMIPDASQQLAPLLRQTNTTLANAKAPIQMLRGDLPTLKTSLQATGGLASNGISALRPTTQALKSLQPILEGTRYYAPDLILGIFNGLLGNASANYDRTGHYSRMEFQIAPQSFLAGTFSNWLIDKPLYNGLFNLQHGRTAICPGGSEPPAPDGSNPWVIPGLCNPDHNFKSDINKPFGGAQ